MSRVERPAVFRVTNEVLNPGLEPFTVTVGSIGNAIGRDAQDGFEPVTFRTQLMAGQDAPDRIHSAHPAGIHHWNSWGHGYLDGATVHVYRVLNRKLVRVREDTVVEGGTVIEQWNHAGDRLLPPETTEAFWGWAPWSRSGTRDWFTVMAVDQAGNRYPAPPVQVARPDGPHPNNADQRNATIAFRPRPLDATEALTPPQNVRVALTDENLLRFTWDAMDQDQLAGFQIAQSDIDPAGHRGVYLQLAGQPDDPHAHIRKDDLVIVHTVFREFDRRWLANRLGQHDDTIRRYYPGNVPNDFHPHDTPGKAWRLVDHPAGTPVAEPGQTYLEMTLRAGDTERVGQHGIPDIASTQQDFYPVPFPAEYIMEVWIKADREAAPPVTFEANGCREVGAFLEPFTFQPTTEWQRIEHRFTGAPSDTGGHVYFVLTCHGPATYSIDNFRIYRADTPYLGLLPHEQERYRQSGMMAMRTHGPIKTGEATYSMAAFTNPGGVIQGIRRGNTLPQLLREIEALDSRPWLQIEYHMSPEEWLGFIEFMAAPYDPSVDSPETKPWAAKRYAQGRAGPWVDAFDRIYFELGNETWNRIFAPWIFHDTTDAATGERIRRGELYGMMHDQVVAIFRSSPYWSEALEAKFVQVLGGWTIGTYSQEAVNGSSSGDFVTVAAYNGGWDEGEGPPRLTPGSYFNVLAQPNVTTAHRARRLAEVALRAADEGRDLRIGTYEAGPGYAMDGLNNARLTREEAWEQEQVMKSKLAGTATLDAFLMQARFGYQLQNFFTLGEGERWTSHSRWWLGGHPHPSFLALQLFNRLGTGDLLAVETRNVSTANFPPMRRREALENGPLATAYATRQGSRVTVFAINRAFPGYPDPERDGYTRFGLELPFTRAGSITLYRLSGDITDYNIDADRVRIEQHTISPRTLRNGRFAITPATGGDERGLPPGEVFVYVFEDTNMGPTGRTRTWADIVDQPIAFHPAE